MNERKIIDRKCFRDLTKEGRLTILDVLSAQLTWVQAYTNLIQSYYEQKIALADYRKATGIRYLG